MSSKLEKDVAWKAASATGIITGANSGLGFEAARQVLQLGLRRLILAVRSQNGGDVAAKKLTEEYPEAEIRVWIVDLADYDSVINFANRCKDLGRLDFVILNAAVQLTSFIRNEKTGHEMTLQTNYLSTVLLVLLLARVMKERKIREAGKPPVITAVGSDTMYLSKFETPGPILSTLDAEHVSPDDVIINVCNPGLTAGTGLGRDPQTKPGVAARLLVPIVIKALGRPLKVGASVYVHAVVAGGRESHGSFVSDWSVKPYARLMYKQESHDISERLWQETMEELRFASDSGFPELFTAGDHGNIDSRE
ncbi:hypothetical protein DL768_007481 [Monosporascus sp. mg162]|nr:hypothetical protein DL768_007481 [Monosporascus sp. mg162]